MSAVGKLDRLRCCRLLKVERSQVVMGEVSRVKFLIKE